MRKKKKKNYAGFCNFSKYKILCCMVAPMQKICSGVGGKYEFSMA